MEFQPSTSGRPVDLHAICRLCLSDRNDSLKSVFDEILGPNRLPVKIELLLQLKISKHDRLSTMVCNDCIIRLDTWFAYKRQCHRNQTKLAEWLNISRDGSSEIHDTGFQIKQEPLDQTPLGLLPVKVEVNDEDEEYGDMNMSMGYSQESNEHLYLEDLDINALETDDDRRCPDCGRMFGSAQNRRRHQNMLHMKKERRSQMAEIRKSMDGIPSEYQRATRQQILIHPQHEKSEPMDIGPSTSGATDNYTEAISDATAVQQDHDTSEAVVSENVSSEPNNTTVDESASSSEKVTDMDMKTAATEVSDVHDKTTSEDLPAETIKEDQEQSSTETSAPKEQPSQNEDEQSSENNEVEKASENNEVEKASENNEAEKSREIKEEVKTEQKPANELNSEDDDEKKILFAAGLRLLQKDSAPIEMEALSKIELSYIEKCKAMVSMFHTLQCACHNVQHKTLRYLLSHLRETRIWFPLFTCYNCMISLTDRSTFTRHHSRCPRPQLETLIKLSNLRKRSEIKPRLYQNFKCNRCKFLFSFHEDFCKHIDEDHAYGSPPFYCSCRYVFDTLEEYKTHCYTSCVLSFYCDFCFITTPTVEEFIKHAQELHDTSEGFLLLQENTYIPRNNVIRHKEADDESNVLEGKRERRKSVKEPIMVQIYDREIPPDLKEIPTRVIKRMIQLENVPTTGDGWNKTPACCPLCKKQYSSVNNMMRHYRTHIERREVEIPKFDDEDGTGTEDLYTCPDCGGVYPSSKWQKHLEEKHSPKTCSDCDKEFQFQSELDQHRSVHLNLKVYRDSKTQAYKSSIVSPTSESNGLPGDVMVMCEICDDMFTSKEELKNHKLLQHDSGSVSGTSSNCEMPADDDPLNLDEAEANDADETVASQSSEPEKPFCDPCNKPFASEKSLREHVLNKHGAEFLKRTEYPKKCELCDKVCTTGAGFKLHMQMHDRLNQSDKNKGEFPKKCEYCDRMCSTGAGLYLHTQMHERVTLGELKRKKDDKKKIEVFKQEEEDESYHTCKRCFKVFGTRGKLKEHMKCHGIISKPTVKKHRKVLCDLCHVALDGPEELAKHKFEEHSEELDEIPNLTSEMDIDEDTQGTSNSDSIPSIIYACDVCEATFGTKPELKSHKEIHFKPKTKNSGPICKYCKVSFESVSELTKHMHIEHGETAKPKLLKEKPIDTSDKPFKCPICGKGFATMGAMTTHSGWHKRGINNQESENTPQATAAAKLAKKEKLLKKIATAAVTKQEPIEAPEFQCSTCFMELPNETALQIHALEKHGNLDAVMLIPRCNTCNQDFASQEEYETHKRFHDFLERQKKHEQMQTPIIHSVQSVAEVSTKKFPCNWCNSIFSRQDTLNTHIKNHHKEHVKTEFVCHQCNRVFDKQNSLTIHLKVHQKQKYAAVAAAQAGVSTHVAGGSTGKVFVCSLCNMGFSYPKDLRMHTINAHPF